MKQFYKLTAFIVLLSTTSFNALNAQCNWWVKSFGGVFADRVTDMKSDITGNIYVCGSFSGTINLDTYTLTSAGDKDVFVAKLNSSGTVLWAKQGGGVYEDQATALTLDASGNVYVGGKYSTSATFNGNTINNASSFLLNYTTSGTFGWVKNIASASTIDDITLKGDFLYLTGNMSAGNTFESIKLGTDYYSTYLAKYVIDGKINSAIGLKFYSGSPKKITIDNSSNISILSEFYGKINLNKDTISSIGGYDLIVLNYSPSLTLNWYKTGGGSGSDNAQDITTDASGNVYVLGTVQSSGSFSGNTISTPGNEGYVIAKYSNTGNLAWVNSYGTTNGINESNYEKPTIIVDNNNSIYTTGALYGGTSSPFKFNGNSVYSSDYFYGGFILKCSTSGDFQDIKFNGSPVSTLLSTKNGIYGISTFEYSTNFSSTKLTTKGLTDFFICKISSLADLDVATPKLCMVSLDPITNKNKIVWEKPTTSNIDKYIIYRENVLEDDDSIGYQNYSGSNYFIDNTTSPEKKAESYRIGVIDVCGNKSALSDGITTMHLMIYPGPNQKWSLLWNQYDDANYYRIYRGTSPTNKVVFDSIAAYDDILLYTDINSPSGSVFYAVEAVLENNCGTSQGSMAGRIRSNNAYYTAETMGLDNLQTLDAEIYPNPTKGLVSVQLTDKTSADNSTLTVINPLGQIVFTQQLIQTKTDVDLSNYPKGIYVLKVQNDNHFSFHKLIVE